MEKIRAVDSFGEASKKLMRFFSDVRLLSNQGQNLKAKSIYTSRKHNGSEGIIPLIVNVGTRWVWVVKFMSRPIYRRGRTLVPTA